MIRRMGGIITNFYGALHLPVIIIPFQCREIRDFHKREGRIVHVQGEKRVPNGNYVQLTVVHLKLEYSIFIASTMGGSHSAWASSMKYIPKVLSISCFLVSLTWACLDMGPNLSGVHMALLI